MVYAYVALILVKKLKTSLFLSLSHPMPPPHMPPPPYLIFFVLPQVAPVVVGKPNPLLIRQLMDLNGLEASKTLMVGDRLDTDIKFGNAGGVSSALVLTGVSEMLDVVGLAAGGDSTPRYLLNKLGDILSSAEAAAAAWEAESAKPVGPASKI